MAEKNFGASIEDIDYEKEYYNGRQEIKDLKEELAGYKLNGGIRFYYELNRFVNGVAEVMASKTVKSLLTSDGKDDDAKKLEKHLSLIKSAKEHAMDMQELKSALGLTGSEDADKKKPFIERLAVKRPD